MLPHTHFMVGLLLGLLAWRNGLISWKLAIVVAIIAAIVDIDHIYAYHRKHGDWHISGAWQRAIKFHEPERTVIHHAYGFVVVTILLIIIGVFSPQFAIVGGLGYFSHYLIDHMHVTYEGKLQEGKFTIPLSYLEILINSICIPVVLILFFA